MMEVTMGIWIFWLICILIGVIIGSILCEAGIGKIPAFRFINRIHRYIYVPLFRKKWTVVDEWWYNMWERCKKDG